MQITIEADEIRDKIVPNTNTTSMRVSLPKAWAGRRVRVFLLPEDK